MSGEHPVIKTIEDWVDTLGRLSVHDIGIPMNSLSKEEAEERGLILDENRWVTPDEMTIQAKVRAMTPLIMLLGLVCVAFSAEWAYSILALERSPLTPFLNPKLLEALVPFIAGVGLLRYRNWATWSLFIVVLAYMLLMRLETLVWSSFPDDAWQSFMAVCALLTYVGCPAFLVFNSTALRVFNVSKKRLLVSIVVALIVAPLGFVALYDTDSQLIEACTRGNIKKAEFLLNRGANVNARDHGEHTLLMQAPYWDHPEIVRMLLRHGADPNTTDNDGWTPLHKAAVQGNPALVRALLENGADINARNEVGITALMAAVYLEKVEAARLLLQEGADFHAFEQYGCTPLELASSLENEEMAKLIREYGAKE